MSQEPTAPIVEEPAILPTPGGNGQHPPAPGVPSVQQPAGVVVEERRSRKVAVKFDSSPGFAALAAKVHQGMRPDLDVRVQRELGELITIFPTLSLVKNGAFIDEADVLVTALLQQPPNIEMAKKIRRRLGQQIRRDRLINSSPASAVSVGLAVVAYFMLPVVYLLTVIILAFGVDTYLGVPIHTYAIVFAFGATGSMVSIMVRIQQFTYAQYKNSLSLFLTGLFRPIIGIGFAFFIFAALESGIITITFPPGKDAFFYAAISFIAGFSERFGQSIARKAEGLAEGDTATPTTDQTTEETLREAQLA
jgi:hypothetical protein